jgi:hypothetical protein
VQGSGCHTSDGSIAGGWRYGASILAALALALALSAGEARAAVFCGKTITKDTKLKHDLVDCPADGLVIGENGITLDLNGHRIDGTGAPLSDGVATNSHAELLIKGGGGGRVTGFDTGILVTSGLDNRVNGVRVQGSAGIGVLIGSSNGATLRNSRIVGSKSYGVQVNASDDVEVSDNEVEGPENSGFGVTGISVSNSLSSGNVIRRNLLRGGPAGDWGILVHGGAQDTVVRKNVAKGWSQFGIEAYDSAADTTLALNKTVNNGADGIHIDGATGSRVVENLTRGNVGEGIELGQGSVEVGGNTALDNDGWGILVDGIGPVTDLGGNQAAGNGLGQCSGVACAPP